MNNTSFCFLPKRGGEIRLVMEKRSNMGNIGYIIGYGAVMTFLLGCFVGYIVGYMVGKGV